ncbi:MAG: TerB N-terminal domain-containing protein [Candidatus Azobacteroides sp.]|nr:TerB N-terminal domain-containing protein [Candidatus Azobacteroides sp.]
MFGLKKYDNDISTINEIENKDLLFISYDEQIPKTYRGVVFSLYIDKDGHVQCEKNKNQMPDPSTIYIHLPITEDYKVEPLPYWPHYIDIEPGQRFVYLNWLRNVDAPIDTGYVFLYYYGLERHLLVGDFDKAFNQIIRLRNTHKNKSFQKYSEQALIHSCILRNRLDMLVNLHEKTEISGFSNAQFLLAYNLKMDLSAQNILQVFHRAFSLSRKTIKENYNLLEECTKEVLHNKFGSDVFPIKSYDISKTKTTIETRFANYSFPEEIQKVEITDFYQCKSLMTDIEYIFNLSYKNYKEKIAFERKKQNLNKSSEEIKQAKLKRDINRYKKLLSDKKLNQEEFDVLLNFINNKNSQS